MTSTTTKTKQLAEAAARIAGLGAFVRLDGAAPRRFKKEVLRVWSGVDPNTGKPIAFDRAFLERLATNTNRWIALGHDVFAPDGHTSEAMKNLGTWISFAVEGDRLFGVFEAADDDVASRIGTRIKGVSIFARGPELASTGDEFDVVILHCCLTPCPVLPGQSNFVRLARETTMTDKTKTETKVELAAKGGDDGSAGLDLASALKVLLGLDAGTDDAALIDSVRSLCMGDDGDEDDAEGEVIPQAGDVAAGTPYMSKLARAVEKAKAEVKSELSKEIESLKTKEAKRRRDHAVELVELARKRSAEVGILIGEDDRKKILGLLEHENDQLQGAGRDLLNLHLARIEDAGKFVGGAGVRPLKDESVKAEEKAIAESDKAVAELLLARGIKYEPAKRAGKES